MSLQHIVLAAALFGQAFFATKSFAWGETGHNLIGRAAARLIADDQSLKGKIPDATTLTNFQQTFTQRYVQMGHLANIADIYWRNLDNGDQEDGSLLGDAAHFLDSDIFVDSSGNYQISLDYEEAKKQYVAKIPGGKFFQNGTLPWRTQQLFNLYVWNLKQYPKDCKALSNAPVHPTKTAIAFAGVMAHYTGDVVQPYHVTTDYDGIGTDQKGIHAFFETIVVDSLEFGLDRRVYERAKRLLNAPSYVRHSVAYFLERAQSLFGSSLKPENEVVALLFAVANDSLEHKDTVAKLDATYAVASAAEAWELPKCKDLTLAKQLKAQYDVAQSRQEQRVIAHTKVMGSKNAQGNPEPPCRRDVDTLVDIFGNRSNFGIPVKYYFTEIIESRMAIGAAITSYLWSKGYVQGNTPQFCSTYQYALKPSFVSPTDANCFGYALQESPADFKKANGSSALPWVHSALATSACLSF